MYPDNYRYTKEHEWVHVENGIGTIGITDHAQHELGDIVYVEVPKVGTHIEQGKNFAVVESVKAASEIFAPISGEVIEANDTLTTTPELINSDALRSAECGLLKIKLSVPEEIDRPLSPHRLSSLSGRRVSDRLRYLPKSDAERREMLDTIGLARIEDLIAHLPAAVRFKEQLAIQPGRSEYDILDYFKARGAENANGYSCFLGAGVYNHYRPVLVDTVVSRSEFLTAYTPYQAEISQGTLTAIFEFQSMICQLTGMDVANASMYDASTAVPEAAMMAIRATGRSNILTARSVHPEYREVLQTYTQHQGIPLAEFGYDAESGMLDIEALSRTITKDTAAVIIQTPNFFGIVENVKQAAAIAHEHGALLVVVFSEAVSLGLLEPPRDADIVAGELQSFALPPSYGGPFAGVIACKEKLIRQIPGRLAGETKDANGNRAFCLTLATREEQQHPPA